MRRKETPRSSAGHTQSHVFRDQSGMGWCACSMDDGRIDGVGCGVHRADGMVDGEARTVAPRGGTVRCGPRAAWPRASNSPNRRALYREWRIRTEFRNALYCVYSQRTLYQRCTTPSQDRCVHTSPTVCAPTEKTQIAAAPREGEATVRTTRGASLRHKYVQRSSALTGAHPAPHAASARARIYPPPAPCRP